MRLGIDLRHVATDGSPGAGVSHASKELANELLKRGSEKGIEVVLLQGSMRSWELARRIKQEKIDALFCSSGAVPPFIGLPAYPWVHDVAIFKHPEWFSQSFFKRLITTRLFLRGIRRAKHVFVVSDDTKKALIELLDIAENLITVTYQGIKPIQPGPSGGYALILGSVNPRKNIDFVRALWPEVEKRVSGAKLVIAGEPYRIFDDEERDELIRHASLLLLPSLHEGFGRTALEAMSAGVPVIASNRGAIPEVVGNAGLLLDPTDRVGWIEAITKGLMGGLDGSQGPVQAKRFSWEATAQTILAKIAKDW